MLKSDMGLLKSRDRRIELLFNGSTEFTFKSASGSTWLLDFREEQKVMGKYLPLDFIMVLNRSSVDLSIYPNQNKDREIFLGNNRERTILEPCNSLLITSTGTFSANEVIVICKKSGL
jgi:hypothetical protein